MATNLIGMATAPATVCCHLTDSLASLHLPLPAAKIEAPITQVFIVYII
jgi:hypothetical protein